MRRPLSTIFGVDFSGARAAGKYIWIAQAQVTSSSVPLRLLSLDSLETLSRHTDRTPALKHLVQLINQSQDALWGMDFPFSLPIELLDDAMTWPDLLQFLARWKLDAYDFGLWCLSRAKALGGPNHIYRPTDRLQKTPFSCYHYRIIYQTFHGMRDVLLPLLATPQTAVLPFQGKKLPRARRILAESCPSSTLKRLALPHHNYKQPQGGPLAPRRRRTRRQILQGLQPHIHIPPALLRKIMRNPGGDALDAVIAAVGVAFAWQHFDHAALAQNPRYRREGYIYA